MPDAPSATSRWLDRFFDSYHRHRPVNATFIGVHDHDDRLPDYSDAGVADVLADIDALLASAPSAPSVWRPSDDALADPFVVGSTVESGRSARTPGPAAEALDVRLACGFLKGQRWEYAGHHFHRGNPSLYTGEAVFGVMSLFLGHGGEDAHRIDAAARRMEAVPGLLRQGREQVRSAPGAWTERAIRECRGALAFFRDGVDALDEVVPGAVEELRGPADVAARAFAEHSAWLESDLAGRTDDSVAAGEEALEAYLRGGHFLEQSADDLVAAAEEEMARCRSRLEAGARAFGEERPADALACLADLHPDFDGYLEAYRIAWDEIRVLSDAEGLVTWPDFPIRYVPRPEWCRAAAPDLYFLFYRSPASYERPPVHEYLVTPIDEDVPEAERIDLLRAHNDSVIKLNHVIHHGGIGHHVQNWHAFRSASRVGRVAAVDCATRTAMPCGGTMAEGWACYATDLIGEFGGLSPLERYAETNGRIRMCARTIVDLELHRGRMSLDDAARFYQENAGMHAGAARAEAVKNSMFPGGAVMYLSGTDAIHELRRDLSTTLGNDFDLRDFHDTFLSYGSVPVALVAEDMRREARARAV